MLTWAKKHIRIARTASVFAERMNCMFAVVIAVVV